MLFIYLALLFCGCSGIKISDGKGSIHHLIVGIGIVTCPDTRTENGILATKSNSLGLQISNQPGLKFALGYASSYVTAIPETADNVLVEIFQRPFGPLILQTNPFMSGGKHED